VSDVHEAATKKSLTASIERLRAANALKGACPWEHEHYQQAWMKRGPSPMMVWQADMWDVCRQYLSEHDTTAITEEWLRSVGPMETAVTKRLGYVVARGSVFDIIWCPKCGDCLSPALCLGTSVVKRNPTRGDLRTLARALGIELLEQPAPVEKE
jgi:hypothetical protein